MINYENTSKHLINAPCSFCSTILKDPHKVPQGSTRQSNLISVHQNTQSTVGREDGEGPARLLIGSVISDLQ